MDFVSIAIREGMTGMFNFFPARWMSCSWSRGAIGGCESKAAKKKVAESIGTFPVDGPVFVVLLIGVILIVGALTFFPALALGPIVEHFLMGAGKLF